MEQTGPSDATAASGPGTSRRHTIVPIAPCPPYEGRQSSPHPRAGELELGDERGHRCPFATERSRGQMMDPEEELLAWADGSVQEG